MPDVIECNVPDCLNVPKKRWGWHWKQFERARFPSYNRNRSLFGRMLNQIYDIGINGFRQSLSFDSGVERGRLLMERQAPDIIERTYQTAYENTALEFGQGWEQNRKQVDDEDKEDIATLTALAVRDYLTAQLFQQGRQQTLQQHIQDITSTHANIVGQNLHQSAVQQLGLEPGQPVPAMDTTDINKVAMMTRQRMRNKVTPKHSKAFSTTETVAASNLGILAVARAQQQRSGQVITKMWLSQRDARVRDTHEIADGSAIGLDGLFNVDGSRLAFPGDWTHGAQLKEIINCRCVLIFFSQN